MRTCSHCQNQVREDARFCNHCGNKLGEEPIRKEQHLETMQSETGEKNTKQMKTDGQQDKSMGIGGEELQQGILESNVENMDLTQEASELNGKEGQPNPVVDKSNEKETPVSESQVAAANAVQTKQLTPKGKRSKKKMLFLISSIAIIVLLIVAYKVIENMTSPTHLVKEFEVAAEKQDAEKMASLLTSKEDELKITKESIKPFLTLLDSNNSEMQMLMNHLKTQADGQSFLHSMPVNLVKDGKKFLFFNHYKLEVNPVYIKVSTNYKDTDIYVDDKKVVTADKENFNEEIGPFLPGEHSLKAVYELDFFHLDTEKKVSAFDSSYAEFVDLMLEGDNVSFDLISNKYDDLKSIKLYINGKDTGWDLKKDARVGPLLVDGSMNASFEADFPWGTVRTDDVPIDNHYIEFNFGNSKEFKQSMMDLVVNFNEEFVKTFATVDPKGLTTVTENMALGLITDMSENLQQGIEFQGAFHGVDFYLDSFNLKKTYDGIWLTEVDTITYYEEAIYNKDDKPEFEKVEREVRYELVYDSQAKAWYVGGMDTPDYMDEEKMERYKVEEPVMHKSNWNGKKKENKKSDKKKKD